MKLLILLILLVVSVNLIAADAEVPRSTMAKEATKEYETRAKWAREQYEATVRKAQAVLDAEMKKVEADYMAMLKRALESAMQSKDLPEANRIDAVMKFWEEAKKEPVKKRPPDGRYTIAAASAGILRMEFTIKDGKVAETKTGHIIRKPEYRELKRIGDNTYQVEIGNLATDTFYFVDGKVLFHRIEGTGAVNGRVSTGIADR